MGVKDEDIWPGEERFSLPEGTPFKLVRNGQDHSFYAVPVRPRDPGPFFFQPVPA